MKLVNNIILFSIISIKICYSQNLSDSNLVKVETLKNNHVSIIQLLSNPNKYHNQKIVVSGFLHYRFEDSALYFSKDHADHIINENAFWIDYSDSLKLYYLKNGNSITGSLNEISILNSKYVSVKGTFNKNSFGHLGAFPGTIQNVFEIRELIKWYDGNNELIGYDKATGK